MPHAIAMDTAAGTFHWSGASWSRNPSQSLPFPTRAAAVTECLRMGFSGSRIRIVETASTPTAS